MSRLRKIDDVLFPVEEAPVFVRTTVGSGEKWIPVPEKKAIVNKKTNQVLGVVGRSYRLVSNLEALSWGVQCCQKTFPETKAGEWNVKSVDAPTTGGHCYIDLVHNSAALDFQFVPAKNRPDAFGPFIRITNSYNTLRTLAFEIGFLRKVCENGLILPESSIRLKFVHLSRDIREEANFEVPLDRLEKLRVSFNEYMRVLQDCKVTRPEFGSFLRGVLLIRKPKSKKQDSRVDRDWSVLSRYLETLCDRYKEDLGENAYAVFNAITDFASHPLENRCVFRDRNSFQKLAGAWMAKFSEECRKPGFSIPEYLLKLKGTEENEEPAKQANTEQFLFSLESGGN